MSSNIRIILPKSVEIIHLGKKYPASITQRIGKKVRLFIWMLGLTVDISLLQLNRRNGGIVI